MASYVNKTGPMRWTSDHDLALVKEILVYEPWEHRHGSAERGKLWESIADSLNGLAQLYFRVTQRSVRDRFKLLADAHKKQDREELRASGISPDESEVDIALADILERFEQADLEYKKQSHEKKNKLEADTAKAVEMRKRSLETFAETEERNELETRKKQRNSGSETMKYLREKTEMEMEIRKEELDQKREENEAAKNQTVLLQQQQQTMLQSMQQQQQVFTMMMQAQQQQQTTLLSLVEKLANKKDT